jgi:cobalt-zinc-cadmium resistance protein CzcA
VLNGVVLVTHINQLRGKGLHMDEAIPEGCKRRMRPVLMTALITVASLTPMLFASGPGSEVQRPLAVVVIGGLLTSTTLTLVVLPALYAFFSKGEKPSANQP